MGVKQKPTIFAVLGWIHLVFLIRQLDSQLHDLQFIEFPANKLLKNTELVMHCIRKFSYTKPTSIKALFIDLFFSSSQAVITVHPVFRFHSFLSTLSVIHFYFIKLSGADLILSLTDHGQGLRAMIEPMSWGFNFFSFETQHSMVLTAHTGNP